MGLNFPTGAAVGTLYPQPALPGVPVYRWDGEKWSQQSLQAKVPIYPDGTVPMTAQLTLVTPPVAPTDAVAKSYVDGLPPQPGSVRYDAAQALTEAQQVQSRKNIAAAPMDALAYSGMQFNGAMEISQQFGAGTVSNSRTVDGWTCWSAGAQIVNVQQVAAPYAPYGFNNSLQAWTATGNPSPTGSNQMNLIHTIEGYRIARLMWGKPSAVPLTIGFWVTASRAGLFSGAIVGGTTTRSCTFSYTINAVGVWEYKVVTIPADTGGTWRTDNGVGLNIAFNIISGPDLLTPAGVWTVGNFVGVPGTTNCAQTNTDTFQITGLIVLPGIEAPSAARSPFIMRPYDQELLTCMRYFEKSYPYGDAPGKAYGVNPTPNEVANMVPYVNNYANYNVRWTARKRAAATVSIYSPWTGAVGYMRNKSINADVPAYTELPGDAGAQFAVSNVSVAQTHALAFHYVADARL